MCSVHETNLNSTVLSIFLKLQPVLWWNVLITSVCIVGKIETNALCSVHRRENWDQWTAFYGKCRPMHSAHCRENVDQCTVYRANGLCKRSKLSSVVGGYITFLVALFPNTLECYQVLQEDTGQQLCHWLCGFNELVTFSLISHKVTQNTCSSHVIYTLYGSIFLSALGLISGFICTPSISTIIRHILGHSHQHTDTKTQKTVPFV